MYTTQKQILKLRFWKNQRRPSMMSYQILEQDTNYLPRGIGYQGSTKCKCSNGNYVEVWIGSNSNPAIGVETSRITAFLRGTHRESDSRIFNHVQSEDMYISGLQVSDVYNGIGRAVFKYISERHPTTRFQFDIKISNDGCSYFISH